MGTKKCPICGRPHREHSDDCVPALRAAYEAGIAQARREVSGLLDLDCDYLGCLPCRALSLWVKGAAPDEIEVRELGEEP